MCHWSQKRQLGLKLSSMKHRSKTKVQFKSEKNLQPEKNTEINKAHRLIDDSGSKVKNTPPCQNRICVLNTRTTGLIFKIFFLRITLLQKIRALLISNHQNVASFGSSVAIHGEICRHWKDAEPWWGQV